MNDRDMVRLGFGDLMDRIAPGALTPRGASLLRETRPAGDADEAGARQQVQAEVTRAVADDPLPYGEIPDIDGLIGRLARPGVTLEGPALWDLRIVFGELERFGAWMGGTARGRFPAYLAREGDPGRYGAEAAALDAALEPGGVIKDDATPELKRLRRALRDQEETLRRQARGIAGQWHEAGWAQEPEPVLREGRLVIAVRSDARGHTDGVAVDRSRTGQTLFIEPVALAEASLELKETMRQEAQEVERILADLSARCAARGEDLDADLDRLARFDACQAAARWDGAGPTALPEIDAAGTLELLEARHPLLAASHGWREVVPLALTLSGGAHTLVISGPNSGGKTVALQTVGLCAAMTAAGLPVPCAEGSHVPFFTRILTDIGDEQSVEADLSTFTAHLQRIRPMLEAPAADHLCLIDEAGAGTDPAQGAALAITVLERLTAAGACVVCTTHNGRIKTWAEDAEGVVNGRMIFDGDRLTPTYEFVAGEAGRSFAFEIATRAGLPDAVVARARDLMDPAELRLEDVLREAEETHQRLQSLEREAGVAARKAEAERVRYEQLASQLEKEAAAHREAARREAAGLIADARRRVEALVKEIRESAASPASIRSAQSELQRLRRSAEPEPVPEGAEEAPDRAVQEGEEVYLTRLQRRGVVRSMDGRRARVEAGNLSLDVALEDIRPLPEGASSPRERPGPPAGGVSTPVKEVSDRLELIGMRAEGARAAVEKFLDDAILAGRSRLHIIHGVGAGVLRRVVDEVLSAHPAVAAHGLDTEAPGGHGVTVVDLKEGGA